MNYDHLNKISDYWSDKILPHLTCYFSIQSFDDYLKEFSFGNSGQWLRYLNKVRLQKALFVVDPEQFVKKYAGHCITHSTPAKPEDGFHRFIYQISPTLHVEGALWVWIEHELVQAHMSLFSCFKDEKEYLKFIRDIHSIRKSGNTEDKPVAGGFAFHLGGEPVAK